MTSATYSGTEVPVVPGLRGQYQRVWTAPDRPNLWPAAVSIEEQDTEQREERALCDAEALSEFMLSSRQVFGGRFYRTDAMNIRNDYLYAKQYSTDELMSLMFLSCDKNVILACRDEIKSRYLAVAL